jgi:hypothetical protein
MTAGSVQVEHLTTALPRAELWGSFKVHGIEGSRLKLVGWALGTVSEVERVEILVKGSVVASTVPSLPRKELEEQFPDRQSAGTCGFQVAIEASGKGKSTLELRAVLEDETTVPMGEIHVLAPARRWDVFRRR